MNGLMLGRQKIGRLPTKKKVKNIDLWKQLDTLNQKFSVNWYWVKGHSDDPGNDIADCLANEAMDEIS